MRARRHCERPDCKVLSYPDLALRLTAALGNSVLYAERIDVGDDRLPTAGECHGFDAFFFDVSILGPVNDRHFRLGETWWDYWFPLQLAANGAMLGNIDVPLILHPRHEARWNDEQWARHAGHMCTALEGWSGQSTLMPLLASLKGIQDWKKLDIQDLLRIGTACFEWLRARKLPREVTFLPNEMGGVEALLQDAYRSFSSNGDLAATHADLAALKALKASTLWRVARPLWRVARGSFVTKMRARSVNDSHKASPH